MTPGETLEWFNDNRVIQAIHHVACSDDLTILVGAGASHPSKVPRWQQLVESVARDCLSYNGMPAEQIDEAAELLVSGYGPMATMAAMKRLVPPANVLNSVRNHLYSNAPMPGPVPDLVAAIAARWSPRCHIATTNYDDLLGIAVQRLVETDQLQARALHICTEAELADFDSSPEGRIPIVHLHGFLPRGNQGAAGPVRLGDDDFAEFGQAVCWQNEYMRQRLASSTVLIVGVSDTDQNLLRNLALASDRQMRHIGLFIRSQSDRSQWPGAEPRHVANVREALKDRMGSFGVKAIHPRMHAQIPQFLAEVLVRRSAHDSSSDPSKVRYRRRLEQWERAIGPSIGRGRLDPVYFRLLQLALSNALHSNVEHIESEMGIDANGGSSRERLRLELWVRNVQDGHLEQWALSDRLLRSASDLVRERIRHNSDIVSVDAFCFGHNVALERRTPASGRGGKTHLWQSMIAEPIRLSADPYGIIQVGVLTLASTAPLNESRLSAYPDEVSRLLRTVGAELLSGDYLRLITIQEADSLSGLVASPRQG